MSAVTDFQKLLAIKGLYLGAIDGDWGPLTQAASDRYQRSLGASIPPWLLVAERELGVHEIAGPRNNKRVLEYAQHTSLKASDDETPWCSAFANYCMDLGGLAGTHSAAARSWMQWGIPLTSPRYGCVAVFYRGTPSAGLGHVTFYVGAPQAKDLGLIFVLGGNQADSVCVEPTGTAHLLGYRWPTNDALIRAAKNASQVPALIS